MTAYPCSWYSIFVLIKQHLRFKKGLIDYYANEKNNYCGCFSLDGRLAGIILFQDVFAGSLLGAVLGILMVIVTLAATYFMVDGMLMLKQQSEEQQDLLQRAYQDKLLELMSQEMERLNDKKGEPATIDDASFEQYKESINKTTLQAAKLIVKYNKKSTEEIHDKLDQLLDETKTS